MTSESHEMIRLRDGLASSGVPYAVLQDGATEWLAAGMPMRATASVEGRLVVRSARPVTADEALGALSRRARTAKGR